MNLQDQMLKMISDLSTEQLSTLQYGNIDFIIQKGDICRIDIKTSVKPNSKSNIQYLSIG